MTKRKHACHHATSFDSKSESISSSLYIPLHDRTSYRYVQTKLFMEKGERSWLEFCVAKERMEQDMDEQRDETIDDNSAERLWEIARCRDTHIIHAFIVRQKNSNSPLLVTKSLFNTLCHSHKVFEGFDDFVMSFGWKKRETDIGPPHCRFRYNDNEDQEGSSDNRFPAYECAYGLRYVELNGYSAEKEPWSVRQSAFYQKYDCGKQTWVLISPSIGLEDELKIHMKELDGHDGTTHFNNPFELHSIFIPCALAKWRWYIKSLVERATEQSSRVVAANVGKGKLSTLIDFDINFEDRQILKVVEDKVLDLLTIFDASSDTVSTILQEYTLMQANTSVGKRDVVLSRLTTSLREIELYRKKVKTLLKTVQGTASLLSDLLDYENAKIAEENSKALAIIAQESREENTAMRALTEKGTKDAAAVKVITLITITFLPTTVVTGFFSTQFVKQSDNGRLLELTDNWWLIVVVSLPLTLMIIFIWYCWINWTKWREEGWLQRPTVVSSSGSVHDPSNSCVTTSIRYHGKLEPFESRNGILSLC
ncbi:hypothetical protein B0O99DRAFT_346235 [Bisporella sp. PMI_857]|nr:hypothetical protein B0O99DRAFT_346235 [Bisporella sp. PMI_857]